MAFETDENEMETLKITAMVFDFIFLCLLFVFAICGSRKRCFQNNKRVDLLFREPQITKINTEKQN